MAMDQAMQHAWAERLLRPDQQAGKQEDDHLVVAWVGKLDRS